MVAMLYRPPRSTSVRNAEPRADGFAPVEATMSSLNPDTAATSASGTEKPCTRTPMATASSEERVMARAAGVFRTMLQTTSAGGRSTIGLSEKTEWRSDRRARAPAGAPPAGTGRSRAAAVYTTRQTTVEGVAVYIMWRMCAYRSAPAPMAEMFVESDSGDILSPR